MPKEGIFLATHKLFSHSMPNRARDNISAIRPSSSGMKASCWEGAKWEKKSECVSDISFNALLFFTSFKMDSIRS